MTEVRRVAVLGLGVMGGSLARALAGVADGPRVVGFDPDARTAEAALAAGAVHELASAGADAVADADLVILAGPLGATLADLPGMADAMPADATLTDLASLKAPVAAAAAAAGLGGRWVGSHPMCGSEARGFAAARADLYRDARVWLVRGATEDAEAAPRGRGAADEASLQGRGAVVERSARVHGDRVVTLWTVVGARPEPIDAGDHDRLMARVSHLPQLAANAVASVLADLEVPAGQLGPGGRDVTRLAASNPDMWADLLAHAPPDTADALRRLAERAAELAAALEGRDAARLRAEMERTTAWRTGP